ncbi:MAG: carbon storage regulator [Patescibacteria group bacterium]
MLLINRKKEEAIRMSNGVRIVVIDNGGHNVCLGFEAPRGVRIWREELLSEKQLGPSSKKLPPPPPRRIAQEPDKFAALRQCGLIPSP